MIYFSKIWSWLLLLNWLILNQFSNTFVYYHSLLNLFFSHLFSPLLLLFFPFSSFPLYLPSYLPFFCFLASLPLCLIDQCFLNTYYVLGTDLSSKNKMLKNADNFSVFRGTNILVVGEIANKQVVNTDSFRDYYKKKKERKCGKFIASC